MSNKNVEKRGATIKSRTGFRLLIAKLKSWTWYPGNPDVFVLVVNCNLFIISNRRKLSLRLVSRFNEEGFACSSLRLARHRRRRLMGRLPTHKFHALSFWLHRDMRDEEENTILMRRTASSASTVRGMFSKCRSPKTATNWQIASVKCYELSRRTCHSHSARFVVCVGASAKEEKEKQPGRERLYPGRTCLWNANLIVITYGKGERKVKAKLEFERRRRSRDICLRLLFPIFSLLVRHTAGRMWNCKIMT